MAFAFVSLKIFRHGERTPLKNIPLTDSDSGSLVYTKFGGLGQLTPNGMKQCRQFGFFLRQYYSGFLSEYFYDRDVDAQSSDFGRTMMSTSALLSGLYEPTGFQMFDKSIKWQPIYVRKSPDEVFYATNSLTKNETKK